VKRLSILEKLNDRLNPIVIKELRQAVQSKFVVVVLFLFLLLEVGLLAILLVVNSINGRMESAEFQAGHELFAIFQGVLLATCLLFIPTYTGIRLAAERSDTNLDLLFITTLRPRAIIWGKTLAALVLAILIFSACAPFMTFTYLLRGIELSSILLVLSIDFFTVLVSVQLVIFLAVVPANRVFKAILGSLGFAVLVGIFMGTLSSTLELLNRGFDPDSPEFWAVITCVATVGLAGMALLFACSVALISPASANRALPMRLCLVVVWVGTLTVFGLWSRVLGHEGPISVWLLVMCTLCGLGMVIAINERERWAPRMARTIPRRWWLRGPAFLFYSGAAGGFLFTVLMFAATVLVVRGWEQWYPTAYFGAPRDGRTVLQEMTEVMAILGLYTFCYALTAVFVRKASPWKVSASYTWIILIALMLLGSSLPFLASYLIFFQEWRYESHYYWLLSNPIAAAVEVTSPLGFDRQTTFFLFAAVWAGLALLVTLPWFVRQIRGFRPQARSKSGQTQTVSHVTNPASPDDPTRTAEKSYGR
jgi:hypothetical protein